MWYIHIIEYCSAIERGQALTHAATGVALGNMMLSEMGQTHRAIYSIPFIGHVQSLSPWVDLQRQKVD